MKVVVAKLKAEVDKLDVVKLNAILVDLSKLRNEINNQVVKKNQA